ncbi:MAG: ASCH domain-containing protein [Devosia sp.]
MLSPDEIAALPSFAFGDSPGMADELLALVISGTKTATCAPLRDLGDQQSDDPMPLVGHLYVVRDGAGRPSAVIETREVTIRRFDEVPADFALAEGEGDFEQWRQGHKAYFARNGGWSAEMEIVCERFRLVEVLPT